MRLEGGEFLKFVSDREKALRFSCEHQSILYIYTNAITVGECVDLAENRGRASVLADFPGACGEREEGEVLDQDEMRDGGIGELDCF
jgi:hypothetical protein